MTESDRLRIWLSAIDARLPLQRAGLGAGVIGAALYTLLSGQHMSVQEPHDLYIVGALLAVFGGFLGWLAGALLRHSLNVAER